jgi:hypothetical protein
MPGSGAPATQAATTPTWFWAVVPAPQPAEPSPENRRPIAFVRDAKETVAE